MCYCIAKPNINKQSLKIANIKQGNNLCFLLYSHPIRIVVLTRHLDSSVRDAILGIMRVLLQETAYMALLGNCDGS